MLKYEDLLENINEEYFKKQTKILEQNTGSLDLYDPNDKWIAVTYTFAKKKGLKEYQARSFASELTLFLTDKIYDTNVNLVYREDWLDSYLYNKFDEIKEHYEILDKNFWLEFIDYLLGFYSSSASWKYERVSKFLQFRVTKKEKEIFDKIPKPKPKQKFLYLLENFDYTIREMDFKRLGDDISETWSINLTVGEYEKFMTVTGDSKTNKFLNLLYYWYSNYKSVNPSADL